MIYPQVLLLYCISIIAHVHCACEDGHPCETEDGGTGFCMTGRCYPFPVTVRTDLRFSIVVKYPEATLQAYSGTDLYLRGNTLGFNWKKGIKLNKMETNTWKITVLYQSSIAGIRCQQCTDNSTFSGDYFEYRLYINDSVDMIGGNFKVKFPISKSSSYFNEIPEYFAYPWFFNKRVKGDILTINSTQLSGRQFQIIVLKPPSFDENPFKSYPTLIIFDNGKETYNFSTSVIEKPIVEQGTVEEFISVGFGDYQSEEDRTDLLTPVPGMFYVCINGSLSNMCDGCLPETGNTTEYIWYMEHKCGKFVEIGGKGNDTLDFLIDTVLPNVQNFTNNRTLIDQPNLGIMGFSLSGLMACHAAWTRPEIFGLASCQSPSFWWPALNKTHVSFFFITVTLANQRLQGPRPYQKIYLDVGGQETDMPFAMTQATIEAAEKIASMDMFHWDKNIFAFVFPNDSHTSLHCAMRGWSPLRVFFPTNANPRVDHKNEDRKCDKNTTGAGRECDEHTSGAVLNLLNNFVLVWFTTLAILLDYGVYFL